MEPPRKRFKHQSYKSAIREVHLPSAVQSTQLDEDIAENETHFKNALDVAAQLNLSPTFVKFIYATQHQAASIPLLLLHADDVVERWRTAVGQDEKEDEGLAVLVECAPPTCARRSSPSLMS
ncbi:hypothetical protein AURDEDRAFT_115864 [Auricularia subglabra TFB-10046 SS5]|nr:hypothetical protein AURDEDRAFT_115864 [Auricularia subglabra TFB-10046 SS5]